MLVAHVGFVHPDASLPTAKCGYLDPPEFSDDRLEISIRLDDCSKNIHRKCENLRPIQYDGQLIYRKASLPFVFEGAWV